MPHDHLVHCIHDPLLVVLSYLVSVLGSFTALQLAIAIPGARTFGQRVGAIFFSGAAMGGGAIWAMHFIAMLACRMDIPVSYDLQMTTQSAAIAIASCMIGLAIAGSGVFGWSKLIAAGLFMGAGVAGMHYTGMAAMRMPATVRYDLALVGVSAAIAVVASIAALWLAFNRRGRMRMLGSALVMGAAVCGMHYVGMSAATFVPDANAVATAGLSGERLGTGLFVVTSAMLAVVLVTSLVRQRQRATMQI